MSDNVRPIAVPEDDENDFADVEAVETVWLPGNTRHVHIRRELTADETYRVLDLLRAPYSRERDIAISLIFVDGWNLRRKTPNGEVPIDVTDEALRNLKPQRREAIEKIVEARMQAYLDKVFPPELRKKEGSGSAADDPQTADSGDGAEPLSASA